MVLLQWSDRRFSYRGVALWGFALWSLSHMLGMVTHMGGVRTYDWIIFPLVGEPYNVLKYDQVIHVYTYVVMAGLLGSVVDSIRRRDAGRWVVGVVLVLGTSGIGGINEILEFMPVVLFDSPGPGGYVNTATDICANLVGALIGSWLYLRRR